MIPLLVMNGGEIAGFFAALVALAAFHWRVLMNIKSDLRADIAEVKSMVNGELHERLARVEEREDINEAEIERLRLARHEHANKITGMEGRIVILEDGA